MKKMILFLLVLFFSFSTYANPVKHIVFFGDSLSDDGNLYQKVKILPKSPPYYQGRFSNGPTWAEGIGNYYYQKSFLSYSNYAYGGATAILHKLRTDKFIAPMLLQEELDGYFMRHSRSDKSDVVYVIWIGANDYLYDTMEDVEGLTTNVVNKISESAETLLNKGGHGVLILNLPELSLIPFAKNNQVETRLATLTSLHNTKLDAAIKKLSIKYPNQVMFFDVHAVFLDVLANPSSYNDKYGVDITDTTQSCWLGGIFGLNKQKTLERDLKDSGVDAETIQAVIQSPALRLSYADSGQVPCENPDQHLFWDDMHPTAVIHQVLGKIVVEELEKNRFI